MNSNRSVSKSFILRLLPVLTLLGGLGITYAIWHVSKLDAERVQQAKFDFRVNQVALDIESRLANYEQALLGAAGLFAASRSVGREAFHVYVDSLQLEKNFPGIQGVGFALLISPREKTRHIDQIRKEGFPEYVIRPAGEREIYTPIIYLERLDWRNRRALGYDMYSEPVRQAAMSKSRDEGRPVISGRVTLLQETDKDVQAGFLMYVPVYRHQLPHHKVADRRANLVGWVYAPFRMNDLMKGMLGSHFGEVGETLDLDVYDGSQLSPASLMYHSDDSHDSVSTSSNASRPAYQALHQIKLAGHVWTIAMHSLQSFESAEANPRLRAIPVLGGIGTVLFALIMWLLLNGRAQAVALATKMNREIIGSEKQLKQAQAQASIGSWDRNIETNLLVWSDEMYRLFGLEPRQLVPSYAAFLDAVFPEDRERVNSVIVDAVQKDESFRVDYRIRKPNGQIRNVVAQGQIECDATGRPIGTRGTVQDVTEQRMAEAKLNHTLAELGDLYEHAPCGYHSLDNEGVIVRINQTELDWLGYTREEVLGKMKAVEFFTPESRAVFYANYPRFKETGLVSDLEIELVRKDGSTFTVLLSATAIYDKDGQFMKSRTTVHNITARKRAEHELQHLNRFYSMLSLTNQAIIRIRDEVELCKEVCRIVVENGGFAMAWIGMLDEHMGEVAPLAHWGREDGYLAYLMATGVFSHNGPTAMAILKNRPVINDDTAENPIMSPWCDEALKRGFRSSGSFPVSRAGRPVGGLTIYAVESYGFTADMSELLQGLANDLSFAFDAIDQETQRSQAEEALRLLNEELESRVEERTHQLHLANKELEAFSYSVSHDLRAPLRSIDGFSLVLLKNYGEQLDAKGQDYLGRVRRASQRMGELIDDMLHLSQISHCKLIPGTVDISQMVREIAAGLQSADPARKVQFDIQDRIVVEADAKLLRIALENLLGNAWKFTGKQAAAKIELGMEERDGTQAVFVRDNGAGFNMDYVHKLFNPFQRLHGTNEFEGTGIGLATVQRIMHRHGGRVWASGKEGAGATFYFSCATNHLRVHNEEMK
jgi:PAS domain S-box-containing protein